MLLPHLIVMPTGAPEARERLFENRYRMNPCEAVAGTNA